MITGCFNTCSSCITPSNPLACLGCTSLPMYITSCQNMAIDTSSIVNMIALPVMLVILVMHFFMLLIGNGIYRETFENLQLLMLVNWGFNFQDNSSVLVWLNLGRLGMDGTSYSATVQILVVLALLVTFISLGILL